MIFNKLLIKNSLANANKYVFILFLFLINIDVLFAQQQTVSINIPSGTLQSVFQAIEKQTNYSIAYDESQINIKQNVKVVVNNKKLTDVLNQVLAPLGYDYQLREKRILIKVSDAANKNLIKVTGYVNDNFNNPLMGAVIKVKNSNIGTITDLNGYFSIEVPANSFLEFSYIGYIKKEIKATDKSALKVKLLEDSQQIEEVVVVGYGKQKKINLTGAVAQIDGKAFENRTVSNVSQMLQGAIPNLNVTFGSGRPGESGSFNIRGNTSINGGSPLILIDGVEGNIDRINPSDVESVSVLKDASAAAVYGARASYGVILVTTKNAAADKFTVNYSGKYGFSSPTTSTDFETRGYYSALINDQFYYSYAGKNFTTYTEADYEQLWLRKDDKTEHPDRPWMVIDQRDGRDTYVHYANTDWYNFLYDDRRPTWSHNVSVSGGNDKIKLLLSGGYFDQDGIFKVGKKDQFRSYNFRSKINAQVNNWLSVSNNTKYFQSTYSFPGYMSIADHFDWIAMNGLACFNPVNPDGTASYFNSVFNGRVTEGRHTMLVNNVHYNEDNKYDFSTTFEVAVSPFKGLEIKGNYTYTHYNTMNMNRSAPLSYSKYPGEVIERIDDIGLDQLMESRINQMYQAVNGYATYENSIDGHSFTLMGGYNYETRKSKTISASRQGLLSTEMNDFNLANGDVMNISGGNNQYIIMGAFYRLNYNYKERYLFETSGRYDGTSRFAQGYRFGAFPSASAGWRVSEESFFKPLQSIISNLKLRYSYGKLGNQQIAGYYDYIQVIETSGVLDYSFGEGSKAPFSYVSAPNASNMTWEKVATNNFGIDLGVLNQRLNVSADIYARDTEGMLTKGKLLPGVYGAAEPKMNAANLRTKGWELSVSWNDKVRLLGSVLSYNVNVGLSDYVSHITKFDNPDKNLSSYYKGQKLGDIWGYHIDGFFATDEEAANYHVDQRSVNDIINTSVSADKGLHAGDLKFVDLDGDNKISIGSNTLDNPGDRRIIGNSQPRYSYGINLGADWFGFDVNMFFQGIGRKHWYPATQAMAFWGPYARPFATFIPSDFMDKVWTPENPNSYFPRPRGYVATTTNRELGAVNDRYLQDLAYCRLKNLTIGYSVPSKMLSKLMVERLRIYFSGENLFTLTKLDSKYIDPEQASSGKGGYGKVYPWSKTFSFGVELSF